MHEIAGLATGMGSRITTISLWVKVEFGVGHWTVGALAFVLVWVLLSVLVLVLVLLLVLVLVLVLVKFLFLLLVCLLSGTRR